MLIPAIDLIDGNVVRLFQGDYQQKTQYAKSPVELVSEYSKQGADWLHIVDLTGAKDTDKRQLSLIADMVAQTSMNYQVGGGIRSEQDVVQLLEIGVKRVVIGSMAVTQPDIVSNWFKTYGPESIVLALDVNIDSDGKRMIATQGWQQDSGVELEAVLNRYLKLGATHVLCTDISRDGTLQGANGELYQSMQQSFPTINLQASGGIGSLDDIKRLKQAEIGNVILGRSLLENKFTLPEAISLWEQR